MTQPLTPLRHANLAILAATLLLSACAHPEPPILTLTAPTCDPSPAFATATPVPFNESRGAEAHLNPATTCLGSPPSATTYAVFQLPQAPPYTLTIYSRANRSLVAPRATIYDADGHPGRVLTLPDFESRIDGLRAGLRTHGTERYLVIEADRSRLGTPATLRLGSRSGGTAVAATTIIIPLAAPIPDITRQQSATYSLNGTIRVTAEPILIVR